MVFSGKQGQLHLAEEKLNRMRPEIVKLHALDVACVGDFSILRRWKQSVRGMFCAGRRAYRRAKVNRQGWRRQPEVPAAEQRNDGYEVFFNALAPRPLKDGVSL